MQKKKAISEKQKEMPWKEFQWEIEHILLLPVNSSAKITLTVSGPPAVKNARC